MDTDLRFSSCYNFRVIESENKFYIQRKYMIPGHDKNGNYNACISTEWRTLSLVEKYSFSFKRVHTFDSPKDALRFWKTETDVELLLMSACYNLVDLVDIKVIGMRDDLIKVYPEALI